MNHPKFPDWNSNTTGILLALGILFCLFVIAGTQRSCGKGHEKKAAVAGAQADGKLEAIKILEAQLVSQRAEIAAMVEAGKVAQRAYQRSLAKAHEPPPPAPIGLPALTEAMLKIGFQPGVLVSDEIPHSSLAVRDANMVFFLHGEADRVPKFETALADAGVVISTQATTLSAKDGLISTQTMEIKLALEAQQLRATQAQELGKALQVEKAKGWQRYAWGAAGVVAGVLATR